jgi:hypothetical protein
MSGTLYQTQYRQTPVITGQGWNPAQTNSLITLSNSNLTASMAGTTTFVKTFGINSFSFGKYYFEIYVKYGSSIRIGIGNTTSSTTGELGSTLNEIGWQYDGSVYNNSTVVATWSPYSTLQILRIAVDLNRNLIWGCVGSGPWNNSAPANPATAVGGLTIPTNVNAYAVVPSVVLYQASDNAAGYFAANSWNYTPPLGFSTMDISTSTTWNNTGPAISAPAKAGYSNIGAVKAMNGDLSWYGYSTAQLATIVAGLQNLGVLWVRLPFDWASIQATGPTAYDYSGIDPVVTALLNGGLQILGMIAYCAPWAGPNALGPPTNSASFTTFCAALARRYAPQGVHVWEIWSKPNIAKFWGGTAGATGAQYVALLQPAYTAIHAVDTQSFVLSAGLAQSTPEQFLASMYAAGAAGYMDGVGAQPYVYGESPQVPPGSSGGAYQQLATSNPSFRSLMIANGDSAKPIWCTEFGMPTAASVPADGTLVLQSQSVSLIYSLLGATAWAGPIFWYNYQDSGNDPTNDANNYGLLTYAGAQKTSYTTFKNVVNPATAASSYSIGVSGLQPVTEYDFQVLAGNSWGQTPSATVTVTTT